ncbi:hypothetical protein NEPAR06_1464 [Nematocida parisii]|uniref:C2H2-type domain-containing protein n=1 Tax=Nematocida parisii (strain ERTm3) TaxID=935791 RepID=I3EIT2_NEMP3|nr:uncharacterized protein NEPG_01659 [Nematocida parisii ERTm1]EIJ89129.1 hypothetical protein NEQG_00948 [Nematocida parisii ERTm3]KAI5125893.1 hypothetical protein NEPAR08_0229 [Nematocida parisii]EIJ93317.1 hypothetical protein NEPG_01659 [Nematocida parisii ERTm1]KAI5126158.1 hypothetical protein NEPAR03_0330 [Nematocida parisii]KAI5140403.1 hypothetical protein NEPAR04_0235 [Nematocida parisii]|eukprot:XP_013059487.1 hypothetical protein NEPG_01659 [Nematocida parisii ERTm1]
MPPFDSSAFSDKTNLKHNVSEDQKHLQIEEIILKSINDQESLFTRAFFNEQTKHEYTETYANDIIDMCSAYNLDEMMYNLPNTGVDAYTQRSFLAESEDAIDPLSKSKYKQKNIIKKEGEENRPFVCTYSNCQKAFKRFEHLKRHYRIHTGEKPFKCSIYGCNKTFSRSDNLMQHEKIHTSKRP